MFLKYFGIFIYKKKCKLFVSRDKLFFYLNVVDTPSNTDTDHTYLKLEK